MAQYICTICSYVHDETIGGSWDTLPEQWKCPICGAGKEAFQLQGKQTLPEQQELPKPETQKELSSMELSIICSNLARGCEKQYLPEQAEDFKILADFFKAHAEPLENPDTNRLLSLIEKDLSEGYPYGNQTAANEGDRGALRALLWSEKVTRMLHSLLTRFSEEGERMLEHTGVYVCTICGFVYLGNEPPTICPVCKVPSWKFEKIEGGQKR